MCDNTNLNVNCFESRNNMNIESLLEVDDSILRTKTKEKDRCITHNQQVKKQQEDDKKQEKTGCDAINKEQAKKEAERLKRMQEAKDNEKTDCVTEIARKQQQIK